MEWQCIKAIRGDLLQVLFKISEIEDLSAVESVHFSSAKQALDVVLAYSSKDGGYWLNLSSEQTAEYLTAGTGTYDITVVFRNGEHFTLVRNELFIVLEKLNIIEETGNAE